MPPRILKRGAAASGSKKGGRAVRGTSKTQNHQPEVVEEVPKIEEGTIIDEKPVLQEKLEVDDKPFVERRSVLEADEGSKSNLKRSSSLKKYGIEDYDEKEIDEDDDQGVGEEGVEELEEDNGVEEEEGDLVVVEEEDELEEVPEEVEVEEYDDPTGEEHTEMVDATEEDEHHEVFKERRKRKEFETKKNKGFAFLRFSSVEQAKRAVTELKNPVLKEKLKHYGVDNVEHLALVEDSNSGGMNRGYAFVEFSCRSDAINALKRLQKKDVLFGVDKQAKVSFADSFIDIGDEIMAHVKTVFIDGLPSSWDEDHVRELLKVYGKIEKVELARNMPSAKRKGFGFVTFDSHEAAVTCAKSINNENIGKGDSKAKVRARLSRPLERGKGKNLSRKDVRPGRRTGSRGPWVRSAPRSLTSRSGRMAGSRISPPSMRRHAGPREHHAPVTSEPARSRPLAPPRSYDRRAPVPSYLKSSLKREYTRRDEVPPPRSRAAIDYSSRDIPERSQSYRDEYSLRGSGYPDLSRSSFRGSARRAYVDDAYVQRFEGPPPSYREGRAHDYDSFSGSKRPYSMMVGY
ncbi:unnamed protein product [Linum tenue]|uniref:RRM domain-containing protein n=1 Tax=Linum tenue TaxID=586396 RepID=A0AAV0MIV1_9ROSI|nr:unnamed protein product [Linum tenue]